MSKHPQKRSVVTWLGLAFLATGATQVGFAKLYELGLDVTALWAEGNGPSIPGLGLTGLWTIALALGTLALGCMIDVVRAKAWVTTAPPAAA